MNDYQSGLLEFHKIAGHSLRRVWRCYVEKCLDRIVLEFDRESLVLQAEPEDDTMVFSVTANDDRGTADWLDASDDALWRGFIGQAFGWGWITINQQDALDGVLLSFNGIRPRIILNVVASSIEEGRLDFGRRVNPDPEAI
jgi:hypothetical protein